MKKVVYITMVSLLAFSGCATNGGPEYDGNSYNQIKQQELGTVVHARPVIISDSGSGKFLGAIVGAVIGSTMGGGRGTRLTTLGGGLLGGYAGNEINKANAYELTVKLDAGNTIVVVAKGKGYRVGDRVQIVRDGNRVAQVYRVN